MLEQKGMKPLNVDESAPKVTSEDSGSPKHHGADSKSSSPERKEKQSLKDKIKAKLGHGRS